jgi:hypothetical protein
MRCASRGTLLPRWPRPRWGRCWGEGVAWLRAPATPGVCSKITVRAACRLHRSQALNSLCSVWTSTEITWLECHVRAMMVEMSWSSYARSLLVQSHSPKERLFTGAHSPQ